MTVRNGQRMFRNGDIEGAQAPQVRAAAGGAGPSGELGGGKQGGPKSGETLGAGGPICPEKRIEPSGRILPRREHLLFRPGHEGDEHEALLIGLIGGAKQQQPRLADGIERDFVKFGLGGRGDGAAVSDIEPAHPGDFGEPLIGRSGEAGGGGKRGERGGRGAGGHEAGERENIGGIEILRIEGALDFGRDDLEASVFGDDVGVFDLPGAGDDEAGGNGHDDRDDDQGFEQGEGAGRTRGGGHFMDWPRDMMGASIP